VLVVDPTVVVVATEVAVGVVGVSGFGVVVVFAIVVDVVVELVVVVWHQGSGS